MILVYGIIVSKVCQFKKSFLKFIFSDFRFLL